MTETFLIEKNKNIKKQGTNAETIVVAKRNKYIFPRKNIVNVTLLNVIFYT